MMLPPYLLELGEKYPEHRPWVKHLPMLIKELSERWNLRLENPFLEHATCSYVAPCRVQEGYPAILKIGLPHEEARDEIEGLRVLKGNPTVQLFNFDKEAHAMLLEPCIPGTHVHSLPQTEQDEVIVSLLSEIWKVKYDKKVFRPLGEMIMQWNRETRESLELFPDAGLAKEGCSLKEELIASTGKSVLLATDLHAGNVLKAERREWLVIDPKPYFGDPIYDLTQHLLNCKKRLWAQPKETITRVAELAGVNPERLKAWIFARLASENEGVDQALALLIKLKKI